MQQQITIKLKNPTPITAVAPKSTAEPTTGAGGASTPVEINSPAVAVPAAVPTTFAALPIITGAPVFIVASSTSSPPFT